MFGRLPDLFPGYAFGAAVANFMDIRTVIRMR
jgi:hypothetical protein